MARSQTVWLLSTCWSSSGVARCCKAVATCSSRSWRLIWSRYSSSRCATLQRAVNQLMYGQRDSPYRVISRLGQRLEGTLAPNEVLLTIVETVAQALKLPCTITLKQEGEFVRAASYGMPGRASSISRSCIRTSR